MTAGLTFQVIKLLRKQPRSGPVVPTALGLPLPPGKSSPFLWRAFC